MFSCILYLTNLRSFRSIYRRPLWTTVTVSHNFFADFSCGLARPRQPFKAVKTIPTATNERIISITRPGIFALERAISGMALEIECLEIHAPNSYSSSRSNANTAENHRRACSAKSTRQACGMRSVIIWRARLTHRWQRSRTMPSDVAIT